MCENESNAIAAIPCYVEEGAAKQRIVGDILQSESLRAPRDVLSFLCDVLPPDRMAMRSELEKLAVYAKGKTRRSNGRCARGGAGRRRGGTRRSGFCRRLGDAKKARLLIDRLFEEQTSSVAVLRAAQRHFIRLQWARGQMERGASAGEAVKKLQPPVFWKYTDSMAAQLGRWNAVKISRALERLYDAEAAVKRTGTPDTTLCAQVLLGLAA